MRRRTYAGLVLSTALAGCSELTGQGNDSSQEPNTEETDSSQDSYTTDSGIGLTVERIESTDEFVLDEDTPFISRSGSHSLLIQLFAENTTDTNVQLPTPSQFRLKADTETGDPYQVDFRDDPDGLASAISEPVSGPLFPPTPELSEGSSATGWLIFGVPSESSEATLQLLGSGGSVSNEWALSFEITS